MDFVDPFDESEWLPPIPHIDGIFNLCHETVVTYTIFSNSVACRYHWTVPAAGEILTPSHQDSASIRVRWKDTSDFADLICISLSNECGRGPDICRTIVSDRFDYVISSHGILCRDDSLRLDAGNAFEHYQWSTSDTLEAIVRDYSRRLLCHGDR